MSPAKADAGKDVIEFVVSSLRVYYVVEKEEEEEELATVQVLTGTLLILA